jgi:hypothetical protein
MISVIGLLILSFAHAAPSACEQTLRADRTEGFISYLSQVLEQRVIADTDLMRLVKEIENRNTIVNPIGQLHSSAGWIHFEEFQDYVENSRLDSRRILHWAGAALKERGRGQAHREVTHDQTEIPASTPEFHRISGGKVEIATEEIEVAPFEAMNVQVTQAMWVQLMNDNPSHFRSDEASIMVNRSGKAIVLRPEFPVENITWWSAAMFANKLSEKMGFKPAYDFSEMKMAEGTSAEAGTLLPAEGSAGRVKISSAGGDIYHTEGFRLPTAVEQKFLIQDRGVNESNLADHAWYLYNSNLKTGSVAEKLPVMIDGHPFFGLFGNVMEFSNDYPMSKPGLGPAFDSRTILRDACAVTKDLPLVRDYRARMRYEFLGFRLVRSVK